MNTDLNNLFKLKKENRKHIIEYLDKVSELDEVVMILSGSYRGKDQCMTRLRNIDLWIDARIKERPYLHSFRLHVLKKMNELKVEPWPDFVYRDNNHYKKD